MQSELLIRREREGKEEEGGREGGRKAASPAAGSYCRAAADATPRKGSSHQVNG